MICVEGLTKRYGKKTAVDGLTFSIEPKGGWLRQASLGPAVSSICRTSTLKSTTKTVSAMYALECHNPLL